MSDPTQTMPSVTGPGAGDGLPPPPPSDPPTGGPGGGGPDDPGAGGDDRRKLAIAVVVGLIVLALLALLLVSLGGDDDEDVDTDATTTTTTTTQPTTGSVSSTTTESTTTTTASTTTTTTGSTTTTATSSTTTTTMPPPTIDPARCNGDAPPDDPEPVAEVFYEAWTIDDVDCAEKIGSEDAVGTLFALDGSDADWSSEGCGPNDEVVPAVIECEFRYEGGAAFFEMVFSALEGWIVDGVRFETD